MSLTLIVTRDVEPRFRGFLASAMQEIAPGVYVNPRANAGVRDRIWRVLEDWFAERGGGSIVMAYSDPTAIGGLSVHALGMPKRNLEEIDGMLLVKREIS
ncbi:MAG: type I-E CRISPR-associated endoribonuclease Cas2e [Hyphomicrobiales bacterium]|nr:type I-E CRISPR-associated endoribonuclease Cas2e [Hyphomicrobiales bacterium]